MEWCNESSVRKKRGGEKKENEMKTEMKMEMKMWGGTYFCLGIVILRNNTTRFEKEYYCHKQ